MALTLTDAQIAEIRRLRDAGPLNQTISQPGGRLQPHQPIHQRTVGVE